MDRINSPGQHGSELRQRPPVNEEALGLHLSQHLTQGEVHRLIQLPHAQLPKPGGEGVPQGVDEEAVAHHGLGGRLRIGQGAEGPLIQVEAGLGKLLAVAGQAQLFQLIAAVSGGQEIGGHLGVKDEPGGGDALGQQGPAQIFQAVDRLFDGGVGEKDPNHFIVMLQLVRPQKAGVPGVVVQMALHADRVQRGERDNVDHLLGPPQLQQAPGVLRGDVRLQIAAPLQHGGDIRLDCLLPLGGGEVVPVDELGKLQVQKELI